MIGDSVGRGLLLAHVLGRVPVRRAPRLIAAIHKNKSTPVIYNYRSTSLGCTDDCALSAMASEVVQLSDPSVYPRRTLLIESHVWKNATKAIDFIKYL